MNKLQVEPSGDREIVLTRVFDAPRHLVWEAYTRPELIRRWFLGPPEWSMIVCEVDPRAGGRYRYVWRKTDGTEMGMGGEYREVVRAERIQLTELFDQDWTGGEAVATLTMVEENGRTTCTTTMRYVSKEIRDRVLQSGMTRGAAASYDRLDAIFAEQPAGA